METLGCLSVFGLQLLAAETDDKPSAESQTVSSEEKSERDSIRVQRRGKGRTNDKRRYKSLEGRESGRDRLQMRRTVKCESFFPPSNPMGRTYPQDSSGFGFISKLPEFPITKASVTALQHLFSGQQVNA